MNNIIQIVSFNVPYPPDYGGVMDVYYKIKALKELGYQIILHTFDYGRGKSDLLEDICYMVYYYERSRSILYSFSGLPFIVRSRANKKLCDNLQKHKGVVLLEGIHTTYPLYNGCLKNHHVIVRTHNVEYLYYQGLALSEKNTFKKIYYHTESAKLKKYEIEVLAGANHIAAISQNDAVYFRQFFTNVSVILPFHDNEKVTTKIGKGDYILIHGDLSVPENVQSVIWLLEKVISKIKFPVIIAGKNPNKFIVKLSQKFSNVTLKSNPEMYEMCSLIENAHIHLIHSFYPQGMKLKLLNSLFKGRFVVANSSVINNTGIEKLCFIANNQNDFLFHIHKLVDKVFDSEDLSYRTEHLKHFTSKEQAKKLSELFYNGNN